MIVTLAWDCDLCRWPVYMDFPLARRLGDGKPLIDVDDKDLELRARAHTAQHVRGREAVQRGL